MNTAQKILETVKTLDDAAALEVLNFAEYLRERQRRTAATEAVEPKLTYEEARQIALRLLQAPFNMGGQYERNRDVLHER
jgi:hypothetical protein